MSDTKIVKQGYLLKKGAKRKNWKMRWFILRGKRLEYYSDPMNARPKGIIELSGACHVEATTSASKPNLFQINTAERIYLISASNPTLRDQWMSSIKDIVKI